jgi:hypothetical protein
MKPTLRDANRADRTKGDGDLAIILSLAQKIIDRVTGNFVLSDNGFSRLSLKRKPLRD